MATARTIPLFPSEPNYRVATTIDSVQYLFDVRWNARDAAWYFDLRRQDETAIANGLKIALGANIGRTSPDPFFQQYMLTAIDLSSTNGDATFDDIGVRVVLVVQSVTDLLYGRP